MGTDWLKRRVEVLSRRTGGKPHDVKVRDLGYRWGSCGRNGVLYFNWRLLQLPIRLADYVIAHELVHLREGHHGPAFWAALGRAIPDWQQRMDALAGRAKEYLVFGLSG
jgi:predicted metal-dependent hydrolase